MKEQTPLLEAIDLTKVFSGRGLSHGDDVYAVDGVSFSLAGHPPTSLTLVGESGSGKTTIARIILGLTKPTSGQILYRGQDIQHMTRSQRAAYRKDVQAVFQDPYGTYNPFYKIDRVLQMAVRMFRLALSRQEEQRLIEEALSAVDLRPPDVLGRYPHQLSGGERQRVMLARIYLLRPNLIVADEPVSMIDVSLRATFLNILLDFESRYGITCIFITHNLATAYYLGGKIMILCQGRVVELGTMREVVENPHHPYAQLLVDSVPPPNPHDRWQDTFDLKVEPTRRSDVLRAGCAYRNRCPYAVDNCAQSPPPLREVSPGHFSACYLPH